MARTVGSRKKKIIDLSDCRAKVLEIFHERINSEDPDIRWDAVKIMSPYLFPRLTTTTVEGGKNPVNLKIDSDDAKL